MARIELVFGTESGNAESLARRAQGALVASGFEVALTDLAHFEPDHLTAWRCVLVITSTYGNGDPPSNAEVFYAYLMRRAPELPTLSFSVCGLGDTTYDRFAQCGKDIDRRLGELGATRLVARKDCDIDFDEPFEAWLAEVIAKLSEDPTWRASEGGAAPSPKADPREEPWGTRRRPLRAKVIENRNLNAPGSDRETREVSLLLPAPGLAYQPGDSLGIWPENTQATVEAVLSVTGLVGDEPIVWDEATMTLREALVRRLELQLPDGRLAARVSAEGQNADGTSATEGDRAELLRTHHVIDLLKKSPHGWTADALVKHLRPLAPRLYSIASSPLEDPSRVRLLIDVLRYDLLGEARVGVTSAHVLERSDLGVSELSVLLQPGPAFRLAPPEADIIMIGPGTGVAPFRAFLEERSRSARAGRSWLFFGARRSAHDHIYQAPLEAFLRQGTLTRLDLAWSRDGAEKVYVQDKIAEAREAFADWVRGGAYVYVCGDASKMAPDVHRAMSAALGPDGAETLQKMAENGRYLRDVY